MEQDEQKLEPGQDEDAEPARTIVEPTGETEEKAETEETEEEPKECKCPHCGKVVIPIKSKGKFGGTSYRCSECGKFLKPTPLEEVAAETKAGEESKSETLQPLEVEMTERIKALLPQYLPRVYGIPKGSKRVEAIIDTITPEQTSDPMNLHAHIKNFAPDADDRHLEAIILKIYSTLESEGFVPAFSATSSSYTPRYARRRGSRPSGYQLRRGPGGPGFQEEWGEEENEGYPQLPRRKPVKVTVDGQTIETDIDGMMAIKRFQLEEAQGKREAREHELRMKRLEVEITNIAKGGSEEKVAVQVGDQTVHVPASVAPFILKGGESDDVKALRATVQALEKKLGDKEMGELKGQLSGLYTKIEELENKDPLDALKRYEDYAESRGYSRTGKTTVDLIGDAIDKGDKRAQQLITRLGGKAEGEGEGEGFRPEVTRTQQERQELAGKIQGQLVKKEKILEAENELIAAASRS